MAVVASSLMLVIGSCTKYQVQLQDARCPPQPPTSRSSIAWNAAAPIPAGDSVRKGIGGLVLNMSTLKPVVGANIVLDSTTFRTYTDTSGRFELGVVPKAQYSLVIRQIGYEPAREQIDIAQFHSIWVVALMGISTFMLDGCGYH
jgi:CarboxypepD_reg-like domain